MKIDVYPHILPPKYKEILLKKGQDAFRKSDWLIYLDALPTLWDLDKRFRIMDRFDGYAQVLTLASPAVETIFDPKDVTDVARMANDELAELVVKYPDRFPAAAACLPMSDLDASLEELDRAIGKLGMKGIQLDTSVGGKPMDSPEFMPFYEKMAAYDLPIWIHPRRERPGADYSTEKESKYLINSLFGREYETAAFMTRMVFSGILERFPNLKIITHHFGGMISFLERRIDGLYDLHEEMLHHQYTQALTRRPLDYYRLFYTDTAYGSTPGLMCVSSFFGLDHVLFATDMPYDNEMGARKIRETIKSIEQMGITAAAKEGIFEDNVRRLLRLPKRPSVS